MSMKALILLTSLLLMSSVSYASIDCESRADGEEVLCELSSIKDFSQFHGAFKRCDISTTDTEAVIAHCFMKKLSDVVPTSFNPVEPQPKFMRKIELR